MKIALIQLNAQTNKSKNISEAVGLVREAIKKNAKLIVLPEVFNFRGRLKTRAHLQSVGELIPGESIKPLMDLARKYKVYILAGSVYEKVKKSSKLFNTSVLIDPRGRIKTKYRKIHLFDALLGRKKIKESEKFCAGNKLSVAEVRDFKVGMAICYDLCFPSMFEDYANLGVEVICLPSAFTATTGRAHWEILVRARAIENLCYVLAPNQIGEGEGGVRCYGHSLVVGPWGEILAQGSEDKEEVLLADINKVAIKKARQILSFLKTAV